MPMGEGFDLAAIASAAGLGGGGVSALAAVVMFKSFIARFLMQTLLTAVLTGVGFVVLLNSLGFEIVPRPEVVDVQVERMVTPQGLAQPESMSIPAPSSEPSDTRRSYYVKSPFRKS
ncbi:hypothetical protein GC169_09360 [bacterium]|nr:hypothetical protein [bacterium]